MVLDCDFSKEKYRLCNFRQEQVLSVWCLIDLAFSGLNPGSNALSYLAVLWEKKKRDIYLEEVSRICCLLKRDTVVQINIF